MSMSAFFIVLKLVNNKFSGRMTEYRRKERRSVIMVVLLLIVSRITEIPKVCSNLWFCIIYMGDDFVSKYIDDIHWSIALLVNYEDGIARLMVFYSDDSVISAMKNEDKVHWQFYSLLISLAKQ